VDGGGGETLLKEEQSGRFLALSGDTLVFTEDAGAAASVQLAEPESGLRLIGSSLDGHYVWTWFGAVDPSGHPWCYHADLGWVYLGWEEPDALWGWLDAIGWIYTSQITYPLCFSQQYQEWMLIENLLVEGEVAFTGVDSRVVRRLPAAAGFNLQTWLESGSIPAAPSSHPPPPATSAPSIEPPLRQGTRLLQGPGVGSWRLVTHGRPGWNLLLMDCTDLFSWQWLDELQPADDGPVIFQLSAGEDARFWRVSWQAAP
jgi:hypothetical protein